MVRLDPGSASCSRSAGAAPSCTCGEKLAKGLKRTTSQKDSGLECFEVRMLSTRTLVDAAVRRAVCEMRSPFPCAGALLRGALGTGELEFVYLKKNNESTAARKWVVCRIKKSHEPRGCSLPGRPAFCCTHMRGRNFRMPIGKGGRSCSVAGNRKRPFSKALPAAVC